MSCEYERKPGDLTLDIEAEVRRLRDLEAIRRVLARQVQLGDVNLHDEWIDGCLAEDVVWISRNVSDDGLFEEGTFTIDGGENVVPSSRPAASLASRRGSGWGRTSSASR